MPGEAAQRNNETRKLAAIMFTDIVGFSRQMGRDELRMLRVLDLHNQLLHQAVADHHGHVIKTMGDAFLVDFPSVVQAVQCAQHIQRQLHAHNAEKSKEDITTDLSSLFVISRNSAFTYKGKAVKVQEVSRELGVQYVLEGSVRRADDQVRVTAQLIDAINDHHVWAERYDRPLKNIFAVQDEIVRKIVTTLKLQLTLTPHYPPAHFNLAIIYSE